MDYGAIISALRVRVQQIQQAIAELESLDSLEGTPAPWLEKLKGPLRRGRKSMGEAERQQVSERMKRYWTGRRKQAR